MNISSQSLANRSGLIMFAAVVLSSMLQISMLAHQLPQQLAGLWVLALTIAHYLMHFNFGLGPTLTREISGKLQRGTQVSAGDLAAGRDIYATGSRMTNAFAVVAAVAGLVFGEVLFLSHAPAEYKSDAGVAWLIFLFGTVMNLKSIAFFCAIEGAGAIHVAKLTRSAVMLMNLAIMFIALKLAPNSISVSIAYAVQGALALSAGYVQLHRHTPLGMGGGASWEMARTLARPSAKIMLAALGAVLIFQTGNFAVAAKMGLSDVVQFDSLMRAGQAFLTLALTPAFATIAIQSSLFSRGSHEDLRRLAIFNTRHAVVTLSILAGWFAIFHPLVVRIWLGESYVSPNLAVYLMLAMFILEVNHVSLITAAMAAGTFLYVPALLSGVAILVIAPSMASAYGVAGVVGTLFICQLATNNWYVPLIALRRLGIPFLPFARGVVLPGLLALAGSLALNGIVLFATDHLSFIVQLACATLLTGTMIVAVSGKAYLSFAPKHATEDRYPPTT
jgi:O-antigen/teichoic acid export membrane protein